MEQVNHPKHYQRCSPVTSPIAKLIIGESSLNLECIEVVESLELGFHLGNALKYLWRAGVKSEGLATDLKKALWYFERYVQNYPYEITWNLLQAIDDLRSLIRVCELAE